MPLKQTKYSIPISVTRGRGYGVNFIIREREIFQIYSISALWWKYFFNKFAGSTTEAQHSLATKWENII